jgi:Tfp pilus assembly protein PilZ
MEQQVDVVTFRSSKRRSPGSGATVRFSLNVNGKPQKLDLSVRIITCRPTGSGPGYICVAKMDMPEAKLRPTESMLNQFAQRANLGPKARRSPRFAMSLRVLSRDLPGFGAVTVDVSMHGVQLTTHGPVAPGTQIDFTLELDVASVAQHLNLRGRAIWCYQVPQSRGCNVGVEYLNVDAATQDVLEKYTKSLAERMRSDVMQRTIGDADVFVRPDDNVSKKTT